MRAMRALVAHASRRTQVRAAVAALLSCAALAPALDAQAPRRAERASPPVIHVGDTVRVSSPAPQLVRAGAVVDAIRGDTLDLRYLPGKGALPGGTSIARRGLTHLEVRRLVRGSSASVAGGAAKGSTLGAAAGIALGVIVGAAASGSSGEEGPMTGAIVGALTFGGAGALLGAAVGGVNGRVTRRQWVTVPLPR